jgi:Flp pilus assembly protein TadD
MDPTKDIYSKPERPPPGQPETNPSVELPPVQARQRTLRSTIGFTLLMVGVLAVASWLVYLQEEKETRPGPPLPTSREEVGRPASRGQPPAAVAVPPPLGDLSELMTPADGRKLSPMDQEKMAQAMGEVRIANQYLEQQDLDGAERHARKALAIWPRMNAAERLLGFVYTRRGQFDQAIAILEHSLEGEPFNPETFNNLASAYLQRWDLEKAEELLQTALKIRPEFAVAHLNLGLLYLVSGSGRYELAIDHLERALDVVPDNPSARNNLAVALMRVGRNDEARKNLELIIKQSPARASAYFNMAITYVLEQKVDEAMAWIRRGSRLCSPVICQNYLSDSDFDPIRNHPAFQKFVSDLYPDLPSLPEG